MSEHTHPYTELQENLKKIEAQMPCPQCQEKGYLKSIPGVGFVCQNSEAHPTKKPYTIPTDTIQDFLEKK